jgi:hypothetical protein
MGFFTIFISDGLSEAAYQRALKSAPTFVSTRRRDYHSLLKSAGFRSVDEIDLTPEFQTTTRAWCDGRARYRQEFIDAEGEATFEERQADSTAQLRGIEAGLLRRSLFICS